MFENKKKNEISLRGNTREISTRNARLALRVSRGRNKRGKGNDEKGGVKEVGRRESEETCEQVRPDKYVYASGKSASAV